MYMYMYSLVVIGLIHVYQTSPYALRAWPSTSLGFLIVRKVMYLFKGILYVQIQGMVFRNK